MSRAVYYFTDSADFGGAERALATLLEGLDRSRWKPTLIHHPEAGLAPLLAEARRLGVALWPVPRMPDGLLGARRMPSFARALHGRRPAVFHAHLTWPLACKYGLMGALLARVPAVVVTVQLYVDFKMDPSIYLQQRLLAAGVGRYVAVSEEVSQRLRQKLPIPAHKLQVIRNAISPAAFTCMASSEVRTGLCDAGQPLILTLARLDPQKGLTYLLQAAARVPGAVFAIAGEGPERPALEAQVRALGLDGRVVLLGYRPDVNQLLASCDLFVLPSLYEGLPLSVLEAMAAGKPVIATAIGGTAEAVVPGQTGLLVPPADPGALADAIQKLLSEPGLAQQLASAGQYRARQEFTSEVMVQRVMQVYDDLLAPPLGAHGSR